jgi:hypothetical protein
VWASDGLVAYHMEVGNLALLLECHEVGLKLGVRHGLDVLRGLRAGHCGLDVLGRAPKGSSLELLHRPKAVGGGLRWVARDGQSCGHERAPGGTPPALGPARGTPLPPGRLRSAAVAGGRAEGVPPDGKQKVAPPSLHPCGGEGGRASDGLVAYRIEVGNLALLLQCSEVRLKLLVRHGLDVLRRLRAGHCGLDVLGRAPKGARASSCSTARRRSAADSPGSVAGPRLGLRTHLSLRGVPDRTRRRERSVLRA